MSGVQQPHMDEQALISQQQLVELQRADAAIRRLEEQLAMARERVLGLEAELVHERDIERAMRRHLRLFDEPPKPEPPQRGWLTRKRRAREKEERSSPPSR